MDKKTISVVGLGYVGLVTAVGFGLRGHKVVGIEIDSNKIDKINRGISPIHEPGIEEAMKKISLDASSDYEAILGSDITFICIDAPVSSDGAPHLNHLIQAVEQMAERLKEKRGNHTVALRTSVTPGTTEESVVPILEKAGDFEICVNPEFMSEGQALADFMNPSRIIIGECDGASDNALLAIYQDFNRPILRTDSKTAEMIKYASNTFLATKVSFINEMGNICKRLGIDAFEVAKGMRGDKRIGSLFLNPGIGFGGSCLPKDTRALIGTARKLGYEPRILEGVLRLNQEQPLKLVELLKKHISLTGRTIGLLGLAFKPGTDDCRGSQAVPIVKALLEEGARIKAYDPKATANFRELFPDLDYPSLEELLTCDALLILTEWDEFKDLDYAGFGGIVVDGRGIPAASRARIYEGICW